MRIVSFNINSIRARFHQLEALKAQYDPDIIGLQETKVEDAAFPQQFLTDLGYQTIFHGQKGHYGVALLSKKTNTKATLGLPTDTPESQRRLVTGQYVTAQGNEITVFNGYFPQGENRQHPTKFPLKQAFYADLYQVLSEQYSPNDHLLVMGDMNIAPLDNDIGIGEANAKRWLREGKTCFLPEEREWMQKLQDYGLHDTYRTLYPEINDQFSWFDYRSKGFDREPKRGLRIDLIMATQTLNAKLTGAGIAYDIRSMEKPSDHAPIWVDIDI